MNLKPLKNFFAMVLVVIAVVSSMTISTYAVSVDLFADEMTKCSDDISAKQCNMSGTNYSSSKHMVYFTAQCVSDKGNYTDDVYRYVHIGKSFSNVKTSSTVKSTNWRIKLNPTGLYKSCRANGKIEKVK